MNNTVRSSADDFLPRPQASADPMGELYAIREEEARRQPPRRRRRELVKTVVVWIGLVGGTAVMWIVTGRLVARFFAG